MHKKKSSSQWDKVSSWYIGLTDDKGHYFHKQIIFPQLKPLLPKKGSVLDLACGQGVLAEYLPTKVDYWGLDISSKLIAHAKKKHKSPNQHFLKQDLSIDFTLDKTDFDYAFCILAMQDIKDVESLLTNAHKHLAQNGKLIIVLNHPCFRIPRQSSWDIDREHKTQQRKIQRYLSHLDIPIQITPSKGEKSRKTVSHHRPLFYYFSLLKKTGFVVSDLQEWISDKKSTGKYAAMENLARKEIPLFLMIEAEKR